MVFCRLTKLVLITLFLGQPFSAEAFHTPVHEEITTESLSFLKSDVLKRIVAANRGRDDWWLPWRKADKWHFNDCDFAGSSKNIREGYRSILDKVEPRNGASHYNCAAHVYGELLHTLQDFYAHSNWVELLQPGGGLCAVNSDTQPELLDDGYGNWPLLQPWSNVRGVVVVQGELDETPFANDYRPERLEWCSDTKKAVVVTTDGQRRKGLVTGVLTYAYFLRFDNKCPMGIGALHSDRCGQGNELNKDNQAQPNFLTARGLAIRQTKQEWCRLLSLVNERDPIDGVRRLFSAWVQDPSKAASDCRKQPGFPVPPHAFPVNTEEKENDGLRSDLCGPVDDAYSKIFNGRK